MLTIEYHSVKCCPLGLLVDNYAEQCRFKYDKINRVWKKVQTRKLDCFQSECNTFDYTL